MSNVARILRNAENTDWLDFGNHKCVETGRAQSRAFAKQEKI